MTNNEPLAFRMRPKNLDEVVGQQHLIGKNKFLYRMVKANRLSSLILYGPPGTGKTSIASAIAGATNYAFRILNAATCSKKDLQIISEEAKLSGHVVLLLDEIHRLDKIKQDFLLPQMESGAIILIGATTENPYISVTPAIRSRAQIFELKPLTSEDIRLALKKALSNEIDGLGSYNVDIDEQTLDYIANATKGDLRFALNALELAVLSSDNNVIRLTDIEDVLQSKIVVADKNGDSHYDIMSALQKSIRGSDTDAALHYAARLIIARDLETLCRRLYIIAYEDIGLAAPDVVQRAVIAIDTAKKVGLPEARIPLANAIIELALAPKSNSAYVAMDLAIQTAEKYLVEIPDSLKDSHYSGAKKLNHGTDYKYPHNYPNNWVAQQYLPDKLIDDVYLDSKYNSLYEKNLKNRYQKIKNLQNL